jgi:hypothetical protein
MLRRVLAACLVLSTLLTAIPMTAYAELTPTKVSVGAMNGWTGYTDPATGTTSTSALVTGPGTTPLGTGSLRVRTPDGKKAGFSSAVLNGTAINDITGLGYSTYMANGSGTGVVVPAIKLYVPTTASASSYTFLIYEPAYHQGSSLTAGTWQSWDALSTNARWWSSKQIGSICAFTCYATWDDIKAVVGTDAVQGMLIEIGSGSSNADGNVDALHVSNGSVDVTYDFEGTVAWMGQDWDYQLIGSGTSVSTTIDPVTNYLTLSRTGGTGDISLHVNRLLDGSGQPFINNNDTPWVEVVYEDNGQQTGVDIFIDDETLTHNPRIQAGSLFTSCPQIAYTRYKDNPPTNSYVEDMLFEESCLGSRSAGTVHTVRIGQRPDGTVDFQFDGQWQTSTLIADNFDGFDFNDIYLRLRGSAGTSATFHSFTYGDNHTWDATAPVLTVPGTQNADATGPAGAVVNYTATATDSEDANVDVVCNPASDSTFPIGTTSVTCTATNDFGLTDTESFDVVVAENGNAATQVDVYPGQTNGWALTKTGTASSSLVTGPAPAPLGDGSVRLAVGANGEAAAQARTDTYAGTALADLTHLSYDSFVSVDGAGGQAPYLLFNIDLDGNGTTDDQIFYEPVYQTSSFCPANPKPAIALNTWQSQNALTGCWWSVNGIAGATPGVGVKTLAQYLAVEPDAALASGTSDASGAVRIVAGFGAGAWDNFVGNADAFRINDTIYNFDPDTTAPVTSASQTPAANPAGWNRVPVTVNLSATDDRSGVASITYSKVDTITSTTLGPLTIPGSSTSVFMEDDGIWNVTYYATDQAGNIESTGTYLVKLDRTQPTTTSPLVAMTGLTSTFQTSSRLAVSWSGADNLSGVASYQLQRSTGGNFVFVGYYPASTTSAEIGVTHDRTVRFRVRAVDAAGNVGAWMTSGEYQFTGHEDEDTGVNYVGVWAQQQFATYFGGSSRYASGSLKQAEFQFTGTSVAWISTIAKSRGKALVQVFDTSNNVVVSETVDLYNAQIKRRQVVFLAEGLADGDYTLRVTVLGQTSGIGKRVDIEGFLVLDPQ